MEEGTLFLGNDKSNVIVDTVLVFLGGGGGTLFSPSQASFFLIYTGHSAGAGAD